MLLITTAIVAFIALLIGLVVWLRMRPERATSADNLLLSIQPQFNNPVRAYSFETFFIGLGTLALALLERVEDGRGQIVGVKRVDEPNLLMVLLAGYLLVCAVWFFIRPRRIGMVFFGVGVVLIGLWNLTVASAALFFNSRIRTLMTREIEYLVNQKPLLWLLMGLSILCVIGGLRMIVRYIRPDADEIDDANASEAKMAEFASQENGTL